MIDFSTLSYTRVKKGSFRGQPPRLRRHREYPVCPPPHVISLYMLHGSSPFYLSRVIFDSKVIQRKKMKPRAMQEKDWIDGFEKPERRRPVNI